MIINVKLETSYNFKGRKNQVGAVELPAFGKAVYFKALNYTRKAPLPFFDRARRRV